VSLDPVQEILASEARAADVVVFRSGVTDVRALRDWLERNQIAYREVEMPMGSSEQRARFHALQRMTGWKTLPQVFMGGEFLGGERELLNRGPVGAASATLRPDTGSVMPLVRLLGYGGLIPFVAGAVGLWALGEHAFTETARALLLGYGAVILSFLGAIHWGRALQPRGIRRPGLLAVYGVVPSILAWLSLALPFAWAAPVQAALFVLVYAIDRLLFRDSEIPRGFLTLRLRLSAVAVTCLLLAAVST
jgi:glutaredoxin-related protein